MEPIEPMTSHGHDASRIPLGHHRAPGHAASARGYAPTPVTVRSRLGAAAWSPPSPR